MATPKIFESEYRFCLILWEHEPINSTKLVQICKEQLGWSKATTYTVIRRLSERGVVKNENTIVSSLISKEQAQASRLEEMVQETFEGSMPAFIAAFSRSKTLSKSEVDQLKALIDSYQETAEDGIADRLSQHPL
ncbi:MAG: BlaI/MecI/CopY family transcriptional regulator [Faecousia sp.]